MQQQRRSLLGDEVTHKKFVEKSGPGDPDIYTIKRPDIPAKHSKATLVPWQVYQSLGSKATSPGNHAANCNRSPPNEKSVEVKRKANNVTRSLIANKKSRTETSAGVKCEDEISGPHDASCPKTKKVPPGAEPPSFHVTELPPEFWIAPTVDG